MSHSPRDSKTLDKSSVLAISLSSGSSSITSNDWPRQRSITVISGITEDEIGGNGHVPMNPGNMSNLGMIANVAQCHFHVSCDKAVQSLLSLAAKIPG